MSEYLQVDIEHTLGDLSLRVSCALSAPWTVLFGPSGAGKTSLLRVLGGLISAESRAESSYTDERWWIQRTECGYVPRNGGLALSLSGRHFFPTWM